MHRKCNCKCKYWYFDGVTREESGDLPQILTNPNSSSKLIQYYRDEISVKFSKENFKIADFQPAILIPWRNYNGYLAPAAGFLFSLQWREVANALVVSKPMENHYHCYCYCYYSATAVLLPCYCPAVATAAPLLPYCCYRCHCCHTVRQQHLWIYNISSSSTAFLWQ